MAALATAIEDRSAKGIAAAIGRLVSTGELQPGHRLPTVRELSRSLGVSPTTVSEAWQTLALVGAIDARGRQGTFVRQPTGPGTPRRYRRITEGPGRFALDLSTGTPDPGCCPTSAPVMARLSRQSLTSSYLDHPVLPQLDERLRARLAVRRRGADGGRRRDGRAGPCGASGDPLGRSCGGRASDVSAAARPARSAGCRGHRCRPGRQRHGARAVGRRAGRASRLPCSCSRGPTTPRASR